MKQQNRPLIERIELPNGMDVDLDEGWRKLIRSQFGGSPGQGFSELIQNLLDSYPAGTPWEDRKGEIATSGNGISITDYGEGMTTARIRLLMTLGGTDKRDDHTKIGRFGVGFFSVFNPKLGTRSIRVTTRCEGKTVEIVFAVTDPEKTPDISIRVTGEEIPFSTRIDVEFDTQGSVRSCLAAAKESLTYYPCQVYVNGSRFPSVWAEADTASAFMFNEAHCRGFFTTDSWGQSATILCKYERIGSFSLSCLLGGSTIHYDLRDYRSREIPYLPRLNATINCDNLMVTISRDSFYLGPSYHGMLAVFGRAVTRYFNQVFDSIQTTDLVLANHFILDRKLKACLDAYPWKEASKPGDGDELLKKLARAKCYRLSGKPDLYSLVDLKTMLTRDVPLFYSPLQTNLNWVGLHFRHDFIVVPPRCSLYGDTPGLFDTVFKTLFDDVVNLDTIINDHERVKQLVSRKIVEKSVLSPECTFFREADVTPEEGDALHEIDAILASAQVRKLISKNLHLNVSSIQTALFEIQDKTCTIATGLFDRAGNAIDQAFPVSVSPGARGPGGPEGPSKPLLLGLNRKHPLVRNLIMARDPNRACYMLTYLAHELTLCQKRLLPYSPFYYLVKERLSADMRKALMHRLLEVSGQARDSVEV